jgi:uncharacterized protein (TIGR03089 family)
MNETIPQAFAAAVRHDPAAPLLTWYDDGPSNRPGAALDRTEGRAEDRAELSGATLDNWVAKTANLLIDGAGLGHGDTVAVLLPPHWQTAAIVLGASAAGLSVDLGGPPRAVEGVVATPDRVAEAAGWPSGERYATGLLPLAMPLRDVPPGFVDFPTEVRTHGDHFAPVQPVDPHDEALAGPVPMSHLAVSRTAIQRAAELGIAAGDRVLIDTRTHPDPLDWLFAPLFAGASVVLCAHLDEAKLTDRASAERVTVVLT